MTEFVGTKYRKESHAREWYEREQVSYRGHLVKQYELDNFKLKLNTQACGTKRTQWLINMTTLMLLLLVEGFIKGEKQLPCFKRSVKAKLVFMCCNTSSICAVTNNCLSCPRKIKTLWH